MYALAHPVHGPELEALVQREFDGGASLPRALELVHLGGGIQAARRLARQEADLVGPPFFSFIFKCVAMLICCTKKGLRKKTKRFTHNFSRLGLIR